MIQKPKFLDKVKVKQFVLSVKGYDLKTGSNTRELYYYKNDEPEKEFRVIGTTNFFQGKTHYYRDEGYWFKRTGHKQVFIVASSIGIRYKATLEDIELVDDKA